MAKPEPKRVFSNKKADRKGVVVPIYFRKEHRDLLDWIDYKCEVEGKARGVVILDVLRFAQSFREWLESNFERIASAVIEI
jgi:hypothetical protein